MIKSILFCAVLYFLANIVSAQHILFDWQNCIKGGKYNTERSVLCKADSGYFITAMQSRGSHVDIVLLKTSLTGDSLWRKYYGGSDGDWPCGIFPTKDGNYYIVGTTVSNDGDITNNPYPNNANIWIIKIDSAGNKLWDKIYGGSNYDEVRNAVVTYDGGMAVLAKTYSYDGDITNFYGALDIWVLKLDNNGAKQWDFTIGTPGFDYGYAITQTQDSGFIIGGGFKEGSQGNIQCYNADSNYLDAFLYHLDKHGTLVSKKCYPGMHDDFMRYVIELPDGYLISGSTSSPDIAATEIGYHEGYDHNGYPTDDIWIQKTDFNWNIEWQRCYGGSGWDYIERIYLCTNGDYMMFGTTTSNDGDVIGFHGAWQMGDIWMVRLNGYGDIIWQRCIGKLSSERLSMNSILKLDEAHYVLSVEAEGCIMDDDFTCTTTDDPYHCYNYTWLIQINDTAASVSIPDQPYHIEVKLYPNPAHQFATVEIPVTYALKNAYAEIIDASGRMRDRFKVYEKQFVMNVSGYPKGIYLIRISDARGIFTKKFIVE
jgi:hypothetical protein